MKCPRCKLHNPDTAERCDCGYDFKSHNVMLPYFKQKLPNDIRTLTVFLIAMNALVAIGTLAIGGNINLLALSAWSLFMWWVYSQLVQKKKWAKIVLIILTFPFGLYLILSRELRLYLLQKD